MRRKVVLAAQREGAENRLGARKRPVTEALGRPCQSLVGEARRAKEAGGGRPAKRREAAPPWTGSAQFRERARARGRPREENWLDRRRNQSQDTEKLASIVTGRDMLARFSIVSVCVAASYDQNDSSST